MDYYCLLPSTLLILVHASWQAAQAATGYNQCTQCIQLAGDSIDCDSEWSPTWSRLAVGQQLQQSAINMLGMPNAKATQMNFGRTRRLKPIHDQNPKLPLTCCCTFTFPTRLLPTHHMQKSKSLLIKPDDVKVKRC